MNVTDILYEKRGSIAIVTFNRPDRLNAFRKKSYEDLNAVLAEIQNDDAVRAVVLTGSGRAFCAGEDLKEMDSTLDKPIDLADMHRTLHGLQAITRKIVHMPKIVIAALNGLAVGFGCELAIACDLRVASEDAYFYFSEVQRGLMVTNGVLYLLPRLIGQGQALEMMVSGDKVTADKALRIGLVNHVVPQDKVMDAALERAETIAANAPIPVRAIKRIMSRAYQVDLDAIMQLEVDATLECLISEDIKEGVSAFMEKRAPVYEGR